MNDNEARALFGAPESAVTGSEKLLFVTRGENGAIVIEGDARTYIAATGVEEVDPTGAGDTFCGTALARMAAGSTPVEAAQYGCQLAAESICQVGPKALLSRCRVN
jgi:sugar/nucleoside kinase (ribokinase family)